jgi:hypothetical protein
MGANEQQFLKASVDQEQPLHGGIPVADVTFFDFRLTEIDRDIAALEKQVSDDASFDVSQLTLEEEDDLQKKLRVANESESAQRKQALMQLRNEREALLESIQAIHKAQNTTPGEMSPLEKMKQ